MIRIPARFVAAALATLAVQSLNAQQYTVVDLTPTAAYAEANAVSGGRVAGFRAPVSINGVYHATLWESGVASDLHPAFVDGATAGRSTVEAMVGTVQVGWAAGPGTANRAAAIAWNDTAASAALLPIPFTPYASQALATDGIQIAGYATGFAKDGTTVGVTHAMVWDAATGTAVDLGDGAGKGAQALGVAGGQQVGFAVKGSLNAALWRGSRASMVILHPKNAVVSEAYATDGARQVGFAGYDVRIRVEAVGGANSTIRDYATVWTGTATSAVVIHATPVNAAPNVSFTHSFATAVSGNWIAGWAADSSKSGTPAYYHAIVWDGANQSYDLNAFLPAGFTGAQALAVDAQGNVSGVMISATGQRHAAVWTLNPAQ